MNERGGCQGFHLLVFSARTVKGDILSLFIRKLPAATSHIYYWQTLIHHSNLGWISMERNLHQLNRFSFKNWCQIIPFACCSLVWRLFVCLHLREVGSSSGKCNNALDWEPGTKMLMKPVEIYCSQYQCVCRKYYFYWERESETPHRNYLCHPLWHLLKGKCGKFAQEIIASWKFYSPDNFWGRQPCFEVNKYLTEITFNGEQIF